MISDDFKSRIFPLLPIEGAGLKILTPKHR